MMIRLSSYFLTLFALLNVFCSRTSGFPALGTYSHLVAKRHSDAIFTNDYSKLLGEIAARKYLESLMGKRTQDELNTSKRHSDATFNHMYTTELQKKAVKDYLESLVNGQTSNQQDARSSDTLDNPSAVENYVSDAI